MKQSFYARYHIPIKYRIHITNIFWLLFICSLTATLSLLLKGFGIGKENTLMLYLVGVLVITVITKGYFYGFLGSVISIIVFNYFFAEPIHSILTTKSQDITLMAFFLLASLICGTLSSKLQRQTHIAKKNEKTAQLLYEISESFLNLSNASNIVRNGIKYIYEYTHYPCCVSLDKSKFDLPDMDYSSPDFTVIDKSNLYSIPIKGHSTQIGTIVFSNVVDPLPQKYDQFIKTVVYQMALVLDREFIYNERERIKLAMEREHIKSTLLRSISHDIRTPLTGIIGASSLLLESYDAVDDASKKKLVQDIHEESVWLLNSIQNILDMTRISEGHLTVSKEYEAVDDLINQAVTHIPWLTNSNRLTVKVPDDIVLIEVDGRLIVQVLVNLLDNAYKHSGSNSKIELKAFKANDKAIFEISDNGLGIDESIKDTLFYSFTTLPRNVADSRRGVGLGLAICKAIIDAHNGQLYAFNRPEGGAVFKIELTCEEETQ